VSAERPAEAPHAAADLMIAMTAMLWASGGLFIKLVNLGPLATAGIRSVISAVFLIATARGPRFQWSSAQLLCGVAHAAAMITFVSATKLTTAANAILLQYSFPAFVALLSFWLLGERISRFDWISLAAVIGGLVLFFLDDLSLEGSWGNVLAIVSGVAFAWVHVLLRYQKAGTPVGSLILGNVIAALVCAPWAVERFPDARSWLALLFLGTVQLGLSNLLYSRAIRHVRALESAIILMIEPVLNPVIVFFALGERPGPWAIAGGLVVFAVIGARSLLTARAAEAMRGRR
jgi:drug/metabolite transporter (DMT)-like permease